MKPALATSGAINTALARRMLSCSQVICGSRMKSPNVRSAASTSDCGVGLARRRGRRRSLAGLVRLRECRGASRRPARSMRMHGLRSAIFWTSTWLPPSGCDGVHRACRGHYIPPRPRMVFAAECYSGASQPVTAEEAMSLDAVLLSRLQFFWVIALHILLPAFTVGLAAYIAVLEGLHLTTGAGGIPAPVQVLAQGLRGLVRHGRRLGHRHAVPVRHQLEPLFRRHRRHLRPADGVRGPDGVLPRGRLSRRAAVRACARAAVGSFFCRADGRDRERCSRLSGSSP